LQRLHQTLPEQKQLLHSKASKWNENNGFINEAIEHALIAMDFERAAYLIEDQFGVNYERGDQTKLRSWLSKFPEDFVNSKPHLEILHAWLLFTTGQLDAAEQILLIAEKILFHKTDQEPISPPDEYHLNDTNRMKLVGRIATIRSLLASYTGDLPRAIQYARQALEDLPETELPWRTAVLITLGDAYANMGQMEAAQKLHVDALEAARRSGDAYALMIVSLRQAEILRQQGELQQVRNICERQLHRANESGLSGLPIVGWLLGIWGEVLAELNYPDQALDQAEKGVRLAARSRDVAMIGMSSLSLVRVLFSSGELHRAEEIIQSVENTARDSDIPLWALFPLSAWRVRIWLAQGKQGTATQWAEDHEMDPDGEPTYLHEMEYMVFVRILINQGQLDEAFLLIKTLLNASETGGRKSRMIEILILQALAFQVRCDMDEAMIPLEKALTLAEPEGFIRTFVDEGPAMARLLYEAIKRGISPEYVSQLLSSFPVDELEKPDPSKPQTPKTKLVEPLSDREIEVLQLISEGLSNSEIGSRLFLSPNTVKSHARNIFAKIDVNNRTQAGVKARALGLLKDT
ncbi:MAG: LuxR C-terminal-related transcriptional regulator, partial [Anaerolineales bacterium]